MTRQTKPATKPSHTPGTVIREPGCGCTVDGIGTLPDPWRIRYCAKHSATPDLLAALQAIEQILDGRQPKDIPGAVMVARHAIRKATGQEG